MRASSRCGKQRLLLEELPMKRRLLIAGAFLMEHRLQSAGSVLVVLGLSCSKARRILLDQGLNPCLLHWQVDS